MDAESEASLAAPLAAARVQLEQIAREQEALRFQLLGVLASLPPAAMEVVAFLEDDTMDARTQIRAAIQHALDAFLEPAIVALRNAASTEET